MLSGRLPVFRKMFLVQFRGDALHCSRHFRGVVQVRECIGPKAIDRQMLLYISRYLRPDGFAPLIGDTDSGQVLPFVHRRADDHAYLLKIGSTVFNDLETREVSKAFPEAGDIAPGGRVRAEVIRKADGAPLGKTWLVTVPQPADRDHLIVPVLERVMNVFVAGQIYTITSFILIVSGTATLNRRLFGQWSVLPLRYRPR